ncbi:MAG TPA: DNA helicase UvrD, partial [Chitinophagaceae bacterium]|nr:DNA helicase UvrD [Chitinophagaceae bacterium]
MNRAQLHHRFEEIYQGLNAEQRKAVDQIYGPVLVIAGPGTGKTQILSARIGKILLETDYLPENILCLTYTDAGRVAMRKRLQSMIGADAYRVHIHTFHSYCNQIIQENVGLFNRSSLDPISDLERITFLHQLIDGFKEDNPLKRFRGDAYFESNRLANLFVTMKREGWSSHFIQQQV